MEWTDKALSGTCSAGGMMVAVAAMVVALPCLIEWRMAVNEICLPHHFSINYILWPLVELNLSLISLSFSTSIRDHTALFSLHSRVFKAAYFVSVTIRAIRYAT